MAGGTCSKGTYEETGMKTIQKRLTSPCKTAENDMERTDMARREIEGETRRNA